jgi:GMP synthase (glutamine-hydrolysing)
MSAHDIVVVIDFGSQLTKLIARRIRDVGVFTIIIDHIDPLRKIKEIEQTNKVIGIVFSGSHHSVYEANSPKVERVIFDLGIPILGICYGQQLICNLFDGKVESGKVREFGRAILDIKNYDDLFFDLQNTGIKQVWMSHGDLVTKLPDDFNIIATTKDAPFAAIKHKDKSIYGIQFHPEAYHSLIGNDILSNFVFKICECKNKWLPSGFVSTSLEIVQNIYKNDGEIICGLSGGVDSAVASAVVSKFLTQNNHKSKLHCIFVDTGLLRKNEGSMVEETFKNNTSINFIKVDAKKEFLTALDGVSDPEQKRKIIGKKFIDVFSSEAKKIQNAKYLVQGTIYPDVIESSNSGAGQTIKSHHNVGGLPKDLPFTIIEPLRELFKDEVRILGHELGISSQIIDRHPFPGPGLAIRILGEITEQKIQILQEADNIFINELKKNNLYNDIWQAFCVLLPVKTVGVMGDARTYDYVLAIRSVNSIDGMSADFYHFKMDFLANVSNKITNEVRGINRVVYDITSKPPATIEWE